MFTTFMASLSVNEIVVLVLVFFVGLSILKKLLNVAFFLGSIAMLVKFGLPYFQTVIK